MRWRVRSAVAVASILAACSGQSPAEADLVLRNGAIYTMDAARSWADSVAIADGKIIAVGTWEQTRALVGSETRVIDLAGKMVLPGFQDSHLHPVSGGIELGLCNLNEARTREKVFAAVSEYARAHPEASWITGGGWELPLFPDAAPTAEELDALVSDRPAFLSAADGHSAWVNTRALQLAGIDASTPDPSNGRIERKSDGTPSGTLREAAADLVQRHIPPTTPAEYDEGLQRALTVAAKFGIVAMIEASADEKQLEAYQALDEEGLLKIRVFASQYVGPASGEPEISALSERRAKFHGQRLKADSAKIFVDGVIEGHTAALLEPYLDRPGDRGESIWSPERLKTIIGELNQRGFQIHVHAIGDRAIRETLDAVQALKRQGAVFSRAPHLAHIQLFDPVDLPRFRTLGVAANFQPLWAFADSYITDLTEPVLGPERSRWLYPIRSMFDSGALVVAGSDWSVSSMNPLDAIQVGVTRQDLEAAPGGDWIPDERAALRDLLAAYTINGAKLLGQELERGSIEEGKSADLVVLDRNLFAIPAAEIHRVKVLLTMAEGETLWGSVEFRERIGEAGNDGG